MPPFIVKIVPVRGDHLGNYVRVTWREYVRSRRAIFGCEDPAPIYVEDMVTHDWDEVIRIRGRDHLASLQALMPG